MTERSEIRLENQTGTGVSVATELLVAQAETQPQAEQATPAAEAAPVDNAATQTGGEASQAVASTTIEITDGTVLRLPEGASVDEPRMNGSNLEFVQPDGSVIVVPNGAIDNLSIMIGAVEIPPLAVAALFQGADIQTAAGPAGNAGSSSSGGNFAVDPGDIGTAFDISDLLAATELTQAEAETEDLVVGNLAPRFGAGAAGFALTGAAVRLSEEGLSSGNPDSLGSNDLTNDAFFSGSLGAFDPDGDPLTFSFGQPGTALFSGGVEITWSGVGTDTLTGFANGVPVIVATIGGPDGAFTIDLRGPIDHPDTTSEDTLSFELPVNANDGRGGSSSTTIGLVIEDDSPVVRDVPDNNHTADEDDILTEGAQGTSPNDGDADGSTTNGPSDTGPALVSGSVAGMVSFGGDGPGGFSLTDDAADQFGALGLTSKGEALTYTSDGETLTATAGGRVVFTFSIDAAGEYAFRLFDSLDHDGITGTVQLATSSSLYTPPTAADLRGTEYKFDGITATTTAGGQLVQTSRGLGVADYANGKVGGPEIQPGEGVRLAFDAPANAVNVQIGWLFASGGGDPAPEVGRYRVTYQGADGATVSEWIEFTGTEAGKPGYTGSDVDLGLLTLSISSSSFGGGKILAIEFEAVAAPGATSDFTIRGVTFNPGEDTLGLDFGDVIKAVDGDGDSVTLDGKVIVDVRDDAPELTDAPANQHMADEDDILTEGAQGTSPNDGDADGSTTNGPFDTGPALVSGSAANLVNFGSDGNGGFSLTGDAANHFATLGLTSKGEALTYTSDGETLTATAGGRVVFTFSIDAAGDYEFRLFDSLDHDGKVKAISLANGADTYTPPTTADLRGKSFDMDGVTVTTSGGGQIVQTARGLGVATVAGSKVSAPEIQPGEGIKLTLDAPASNVNVGIGWLFASGAGDPAPEVGRYRVTYQGADGATVSEWVNFTGTEAGKPGYTADDIALGLKTLSISSASFGGPILAVEFEAVGSAPATSDFTLISVDVTTGNDVHWLDFGDVIKAVDGDGDSITLDDKVVVGVKDDAPELTDAPANQHIVDEAGLSGSDGIMPLALDASAGPTHIEGSVADMVKFGSDGNAGFALTDDAVAQFSALGLTSAGTPLTYSSDGSTLTAMAGERVVFTFSIKPDGTYDFELSDQIDQSGAGPTALNLSTGAEAYSAPTKADLHGTKFDLGGVTVETAGSGQLVQTARGLGVATVNGNKVGAPEIQPGEGVVLTLDKPSAAVNIELGWLFASGAGDPAPETGRYRVTYATADGTEQSEWIEFTGTEAGQSSYNSGDVALGLHTLVLKAADFGGSILSIELEAASQGPATSDFYLRGVTVDVDSDVSWLDFGSIIKATDGDDDPITLDDKVIIGIRDDAPASEMIDLSNGNESYSAPAKADLLMNGYDIEGVVVESTGTGQLVQTARGLGVATVNGNKIGGPEIQAGEGIKLTFEQPTGKVNVELGWLFASGNGDPAPEIGQYRVTYETSSGEQVSSWIQFTGTEAGQSSYSASDIALGLKTLFLSAADFGGAILAVEFQAVSAPLATSDFYLRSVTLNPDNSADASPLLLRSTDIADDSAHGASLLAADIGSGVEHLVGTAGHDILVGDDGDEILWGGFGNDTLTGGAGEDVFAFQAGETGPNNLDTITDYVVGEDVVDLSDLLSGVTSDNVGEFVQVVDGADNVDTLQVNVTGSTSDPHWVDVANIAVVPSVDGKDDIRVLIDGVHHNI